MCICVCVYVCMYVCVHACICVCVYVCSNNTCGHDLPDFKLYFSDMGRHSNTEMEKRVKGRINRPASRKKRKHDPGTGRFVARQKCQCDNANLPLTTPEKTYTCM